MDFTEIAEEAWEKLGNKPFVCLAEWPEYNPNKVDLKVEAGEDLIKNVMFDIEEIKKLSNIEEPEKVTLFITPKWKYDVHAAMLKEKELKEIMKEDSIKKVGKTAADYYKRLLKKKPLEDMFMTHAKEMEKLKEAKDFFEKEFDAKFEIIEAEGVNHPKAKVAEPLKPGILVEQYGKVCKTYF